MEKSRARQYAQAWGFLHAIKKAQAPWPYDRFVARALCKIEGIEPNKENIEELARIHASKRRKRCPMSPGEKLDILKNNLGDYTMNGNTEVLGYHIISIKEFADRPVATPIGRVVLKADFKCIDETFRAKIKWAQEVKSQYESSGKTIEDAMQEIREEYDKANPPTPDPQQRLWNDVI